MPPPSTFLVLLASSAFIGVSAQASGWGDGSVGETPERPLRDDVVPRNLYKYSAAIPVTVGVVSIVLILLSMLIAWRVHNGKRACCIPCKECDRKAHHVSHSASLINGNAAAGEAPQDPDAYQTLNGGS